jgi:glutaredoxin
MSPFPFRQLPLALGALLVATAAVAQYKIVGPDGKVTYTDKPPAGQARADTGAVPAAGNAASPGALPYETRQAMSRFPVTLFAGRTCAPCDDARAWLKTRGVPFTEYSIDTDGDVRALQARFGETTVPVITVGGQRLRGFSPTELESTVTAAGYPAQAQLIGYRWAPAVPLAPPAPRAVQASAPTPPKALPAPPSPPEAPRTGIQF